MNPIIIDIETKPNLSLLESFKKTKKYMDYKKEMGSETFDFDSTVKKMMATDTDYCEIVCIGIKQIGGEARMLNSLEQLAKPEWNNILQQLHLVTFNGKKFDLPIIIKTGLKKGLNLPYQRLAEACKPWGYGDRHVDMMELLAFGGQFKSLDQYLQIYLGTEKKTKGENFFDVATTEELITHCQEDLEYTEKLFNFISPLV